MNKYELTLLTASEVEVESVRKLLEIVQGKVTDELKWGRRQLSYPINKLLDAYYFTWMIEIEAKQMAAFKKSLNYNESLLRYLLLKVD